MHAIDFSFFSLPKRNRHDLRAIKQGFGFPTNAIEQAGCKNAAKGWSAARTRPLQSCCLR
jgi:hypothetical protein